MWVYYKEEMWSQYRLAVILQLPAILHHPARGTLHQSILLNYISHQVNCKYSSMHQSNLFLCLLSVKKVQSGWAKSKIARRRGRRSVLILWHDFLDLSADVKISMRKVYILTATAHRGWCHVLCETETLEIKSQKEFCLSEFGHWCKI